VPGGLLRTEVAAHPDRQGTAVFRSVSLSVLFALGAFAQAPADGKPVGPVEVPTFANATCPIMGKKVSMPLFIDTELGRFYVCCKPCYKKIRANVPAAHQTAYPVVEEVANTTCPVSGEAIGDDAVTLTLQGYSMRLCCAGCLETARDNAQITLTKLTRAKVVEVGNDTCPIDGAPVTANAFVLIGDALVRLSSPKNVEAVEKDPKAALARAVAIKEQQKPKPRHEHGKPAPAEEPAKGEGRK